MRRRDQDNPFFVLARNHLGTGAAGRPSLAGGHMAMAYDAMAALAQSADEGVRPARPGGVRRGATGAGRARGGGPVTPGSVLPELPDPMVPDGATGTIDFTHDLHVRNGSGGRGPILARAGGRHRQPSCQ